MSAQNEEDTVDCECLKGAAAIGAVGYVIASGLAVPIMVAGAFLSLFAVSDLAEKEARRKEREARRNANKSRHRVDPRANTRSDICPDTRPPNSRPYEPPDSSAVAIGAQLNSAAGKFTNTERVRVRVNPMTGEPEEFIYENEMDVRVVEDTVNVKAAAATRPNASVPRPRTKHVKQR